MLRVKVAAVVLVVAVTAAVAPTGAAASEPADPLWYEPPVEAPVIDPFRPPEHRYGPGNRGLEYGTEPGDVVRAAAAGRVVFAGPVGGTLHVTLQHVDGLRTSYSFLASFDVVLGDDVAGGEPVGIAAGPFHFSVRRGEEYLDPQALFASAAPSARLVPIESPTSKSLAMEREALWQVVVGAMGTGWAALGQHAAPWLHYARVLRPEARVAAVAAGVIRRRLEQRGCTPADRTVAPPDHRRVVVLVAGLSSSSDSGAVDNVDIAALGYQPSDVVRFSYRGGQVDPGASVDPNWGQAFPDLPHSVYEAADTGVDLTGSGARLLQLLHDVSTSAPGVPIDVIAHSQGGLVTRLALAHGHTTGRLPSSLEHVITLGTPHGGADLATAAVAIGSDRDGALALDQLADRLRLDVDPTSPSIAQMAETSTIIEALRHEGPPAGVASRSIAARHDLTVPVPRTAWSGASRAVVDVAGADDHSALPGSAAAHREIALALAGAPPGCETMRDTVVDQVSGEAISWFEDLTGAHLAGLARLG